MGATLKRFVEFVVAGAFGERTADALPRELVVDPAEPRCRIEYTRSEENTK